MQEQVEATAHNIIRAVKIGERDRTGGPKVLALQPESVIVGGHQLEVRRVFVKTRDSAEYFNVGWILSNDLDNCMICNSEFGVFSPKYHCRACGNLVCAKCSPDEGIVTCFSFHVTLLCMHS